MRQEQFERLLALSEKLTEVFLDEAEPDNWPGVGIPPNKMDSATRGDRYWCKKNAVATVSLLQRVHGLTTNVQFASAAGSGSVAAVTEGAEAESSLDKVIADAEKEAKTLTDQVLKQAQKREFDKRTHGKA